MLKCNDKIGKLLRALGDMCNTLPFINIAHFISVSLTFLVIFYEKHTHIIHTIPNVCKQTWRIADVQHVKYNFCAKWRPVNVRNSLATQRRRPLACTQDEWKFDSPSYNNVRARSTWLDAISVRAQYIQINGRRDVANRAAGLHRAALYVLYNRVISNPVFRIDCQGHLIKCRSNPFLYVRSCAYDRHLVWVKISLNKFASELIEV